MPIDLPLIPGFTEKRSWTSIDRMKEERRPLLVGRSPSAWYTRFVAGWTPRGPKVRTGAAKRGAAIMRRRRGRALHPHTLLFGHTVAVLYERKWRGCFVEKSLSITSLWSKGAWAWSGDDRCCCERTLLQRQEPGMARRAQACL